MSVYVSWSRVEPDHRATDPRPGARVALSDPFWSLGRQWWVGELEGFDGGSPIASRVELSVVPLGGSPEETRHEILSSRLGAPVPEPDARRPGDWRSAYRLGRSAAAALATRIDQLRQQVESGAAEPADVRVAERTADELATAFPLEVPELPAARIPAAQRIDGVALLRAIREEDARADDVADLLAEWARAQREVQIGDDAGGFAVETGRHTVDVEAEDARIRTTTARGPALHWSDVTVADADDDTTGAQTPVPVRLSFEGAPPIRWWGVEEPEVDYASAPAGPSDLGQLLIAASLQEQGGVYWQLPLDVPGNCLLRVHAVEVRDGFGERRISHPLEGEALRGWKLGARPEVALDRVTDWMLILNEPDPLRGEPLEEVALVADESDNLIWLIEDVATGPLGRGVRVSAPTPRPDPDREEYHPRLAPPDTWIAYQQVDAARLERAMLLPHLAEPTPRTRFAVKELLMTPAMLGAGGHRLQRQWSLARSASGRRVLWQSRRSLADLPRGGSGLLHDQIVRPTP